MKRLLIFYSHFSPAYKAGGPIQSLNNMVELIKDDFLIDIVCSARDLNEKDILPGIVPDQWNEHHTNVQVLYISHSGIKQIIRAFERKPDIVFINGIFLPLYSLWPLMLAVRKKVGVIFSPRGMLQQGALSNGRLKKMLFLKLIKQLRLHGKILWHATDDQEKKDIEHHFNKTAVVEIAPNVPKVPLDKNPPRSKQKGSLRLVYLSLISKKKNLKLVLSLLKKITASVEFDIYGPIKDDQYWKECLVLMEGPQHRIRYCGTVEPHNVQALLKNYHATVLLTKGENFGHAIYEGFSVGTPAIISPFTLWGDLQNVNAGITVDIKDEAPGKQALERFIEMDQAAFNTFSSGAFQLATEYYKTRDFKKMYYSLFNSAIDQPTG